MEVWALILVAWLRYGRSGTRQERRRWPIGDRLVITRPQYVTQHKTVPSAADNICESSRFHHSFDVANEKQRKEKRKGSFEMIKESQLNLSWPVIGAALKVRLESTEGLNLSDPSTFVFKVTNSLPSSSSTNPKAFSERYITVPSIQSQSNVL